MVMLNLLKSRVFPIVGKEEEQNDDYIVTTFQPCKITMNTELLWRKKEEELRKKYGNLKEK